MPGTCRNMCCFREQAWCKGRGGFGSTSGEAVELDKPESGKYVMQHVWGGRCFVLDVGVWCVLWWHAVQDACVRVGT